MALIECQDCHQIVSDQAEVCPHCGRPMYEFHRVTVTIRGNTTVTTFAGIPLEKDIAKPMNQAVDDARQQMTDAGWEEVQSEGKVYSDALQTNVIFRRHVGPNLKPAPVTDETLSGGGCCLGVLAMLSLVVGGSVFVFFEIVIW